MKERETGKKHRLWIFLLAGIAIVALVLGSLYFLLGKDEPSEDGFTSDDTLYWNVEKNLYQSKDTPRPLSDGYYNVRFAANGEQINLKVADDLLMSYIDTLEVMGLVFDREGIVVGVKRIDEMGSKIVAEDDYIMSFTDDSLVCNTMANGKGYSKTLPITANTRVYMVDELGEILCGIPGTLQVEGKILAIAGDDGVVTHVYIKEPFQMGDVYWNHTRMYDTVTRYSTRTLDELGRYAYTFSKDGEVMTLYTKSQEVANDIDGVAAKCMGLVFDDSGYITDVLTTARVTGGKSWGSWYIILEIDGDTLSAKKYSGSNAGSSIRGTMAADCKIYDMSGTGAYIGEPTELRRYDQVHGLRDEHGEICVLFIVSRSYEVDIYYNLSRRYDSATKSTKRTADAQGWYTIEFAHNGKQETLKTQDKAIVDMIDAEAARCVGLKVEDGVILEVYKANNVWGGKQFCSYDIVTGIAADGTITAKEVDVDKHGEKTYTGKMAENCGVYNVTGTAKEKGEKTTLQVGDKIHALMDLDGNVTHIFVVGRTVRVPIYYNVSRQYDSTAKTTKRQPNAEGYYEIVLAINGEQKTFKTKSKSLITELDAVATRCFGLRTSGDIILEMFSTASVEGGKQFCSYDIVTKISGNTVVAEEADATKGNATYTDYMTKNTKVYNVSSTADVVGEATTLQVGDKIHALQYEGGGLNIIYVVQREEKVIEQTAHCDLCNKDVTWYSWDGVAVMEDGKHYFLAKNIKVAKTAYIGSEENTNAQVTLDLRGHTITASVRALRIYGTFNLLDSAETDGTIYCNATGQAAGFYVYDAGVFNMYGGNFVGGSKANTQCGIGALGLKAGSKATFNLYGGSLTGGNTQKDGGNLTLYHSSVFNMYGGMIADGKTLTGGGNINASSKASINLYGGSILDGSAQEAGSCVLGGQLAIFPDAVVKVSDIYLSTAMQVGAKLKEGSDITVTLPSGNGAVTGETPEENLQFIHASKGELLWKDGKLILSKSADKTAWCQHCQQEVSWYIWDGSYAFTHNGHYYLTKNLTVDATAYIGTADDSAMTVCLDLNGCNIDATVRVFRVYGNLNLMDSAETDGTITGNTSGQASVFYVYENAVFNMYGGTMTSAKTVTSTYGAGIGGIDKGTMNLYGGIITGGVAQKSGGNLNLYNTGVLNIYGGTIENGTSQEASGGNIQMSAGSQLHIYGGSILGGSAGNLGNCINANGAVTIYNRDIINVTQIYLPGSKTLTVDGQLVDGSSIGILLEKKTGVFTEGTLETNAEYFNNDAYEVIWEDNKLALQASQEEDPDAHLHCVCGGLGKKGDHTSCTKVQWEAWPGVDSLVLDGSVYYYLNENITISSAIALGEGQTLNLCLNGNTITTTANIYIFDIRGTLNICDHPDAEGNYKGAITNNSNATGSGAHSRAFYLRGTASGAAFNLFGGNLSAPNAKATGTGGTVARVGSSTGTCTFKMYAGKIFGGNASSSAIAGNIVLETGSTAYLYGGLITGGSNDKGAGNVILKNGAALTVDGGSITNGSGTDGGNVRVNSGCTLTVISGAITGGTATGNGADVYAEGTVTVAPEATVDKIYTP